MSKTRVSIYLLVVVLLQWLPAIPAWAGDKPAQFRLESHLIWATDAEKPDDPRLKELTDNLRNRSGLPKFKWKNYWEVEKKMFWVPANGTNKVVISKTCELIVKHVDKEIFEVVLIGEKKQLGDPTRKSLANGMPILLGGDDKNDSAWFIVLLLSPTSTTQNPKANKAPVEAGKTNKPPVENARTNKPVAEPTRTNKTTAEAGSK